ncbi:hypothetical protein M011DRAFT_474421 [Sporormia fimetaria CBS 119925]|uniref:Uncharacterized protein n=1 Tax=Sporormia fimetaria CBS 119925 TaxID=1340428 RepID=A0A6A6VMB6_9PLEO|nr:hypothetical protein M011DRAFT_474421 [Sporormia fimetaria CBS 119925]
MKPALLAIVAIPGVVASLPPTTSTDHTSTPVPMKVANINCHNSGVLDMPKGHNYTNPPPPLCFRNCKLEGKVCVRGKCVKPPRPPALDDNNKANITPDDFDHEPLDPETDHTADLEPSDPDSAGTAATPLCFANCKLLGRTCNRGKCVKLPKPPVLPRDLNSTTEPGLTADDEEPALTVSLNDNFNTTTEVPELSTDNTTPETDIPSYDTPPNTTALFNVDANRTQFPAFGLDNPLGVGRALQRACIPCSNVYRSCMMGGCKPWGSWICMMRCGCKAASARPVCGDLRCGYIQACTQAKYLRPN